MKPSSTPPSRDAGPIAALRDSLAGAWAVLRGNPDGLGRLDLTVEGFWHSFRALALILPFAALGLMSQIKSAQVGGPIGGVPAQLFGFHEAIGAGIAILADWFIFPVAFALVAKPLGLASRYVPFIVARNWASVIVAAMISAVPALHLLGLMPPAMLAPMTLAAIVVQLRCAYIVARTALVTPLGISLPIVIIDLLLSLTVWEVYARAVYG